MTTPDALSARLLAFLGPACVYTEKAQTAAYALASHTPAVVVRPETQAQAVEVLSLAGRERLAVVPREISEDRMEQPQESRPRFAFEERRRKDRRSPAAEEAPTK